MAKKSAPHKNFISTQYLKLHTLIVTPSKIKFSVYLVILFISVICTLISLPEAVSHAKERMLVSAQSSGENVAGVSVQSPTQTVVIDKQLKRPEFGAGAVIAVDLQTNKILYDKNIHNRMAPASTTKIMTALVSSQHFAPGDSLYVVPSAMVGGSTMGLSVGEKLTFRSLLYGMLLNSGNDAAYTIAANYPGGMPAFIAQMNKKVEQLNLNDTHFDNPAGFDYPTHFSSAYDLAIIAQQAILDPQLARVVSTKDTFVSDLEEGATSAAKLRTHYLRNLNKLLAEDGVIGIKTGTTEKAGESFVGLVERGGNRVLTVVLNSPDRFTETKNLMDWVYQNYSWTQQ